jgi:dTDP-4-amino-4,6-dideoxygalactose transaminase
MDLDTLERRLHDDVLAVLGVHFLGVAERIAAMAELARARGAVVIEDSAQRIPGAGGVRPVADLVVLSFGRGKPAGALGGGALLVREGSYDEQEIGADTLLDPQPYGWSSLKRLAYNSLIRPGMYGALVRVPGLGLGETRYRLLETIAALDDERRRYSTCQFAAVSARGPSSAQGRLRAMLGRYDELRDLSGCGVAALDAPLLRYPVLCPTGTARDALYAGLQRYGLGASIMYGRSLADLPGVPSCRTVSVANARDFAARLLTLPVHSDVRGEDIERIDGVLESWALDSPGNAWSP